MFSTVIDCVVERWLLAPPFVKSQRRTYFVIVSVYSPGTLARFTRKRLLKRVCDFWTGLVVFLFCFFYEVGWVSRIPFVNIQKRSYFVFPSVFSPGALVHWRGGARLSGCARTPVIVLNVWWFPCFFTKGGWFSHRPFVQIQKRSYFVIALEFSPGALVRCRGGVRLSWCARTPATLVTG